MTNQENIDIFRSMIEHSKNGLSSRAEFVKVNIPNYNHLSLHIWTRVGNEQFDDVKSQIDYNFAQQHFNHRITDEGLVYAVSQP